MIRFLSACMGALLTICAVSASAQTRAFPEAEGFGALATGGRGGSVYHVTNLNATGPGSFVDAISVSNRIIVFDVGGVINLTSAPSAKSNLYIAGQTAPGGGIMISGFQALGLASTSNNIVRHLRIRPGDSSPGSDNGIGMGRTGAVILDHLSIEYGKYNNIDAVSQTGDQPLVTIQHSIIANPISNGTSNRGQGFGAHLEATTGNFTLVGNLWTNGHSREPLAKVNDQFINNIEYNNEIGYLTSGTSGVFDHDLVNNAFIFGPASTSSSDFGQLSTPDTFYSSGNVQDTNKDGVFNPTSTNPSTVNPLSSTPLHTSTQSLPTLSVTDAYAYVIAHAGASLTRDSLDQLVVGQVQTLGSGTSGYTAGTTGPTSTPVPLDIESPSAGHTGLYHKASDDGLPNGGLGTIASASRPAGFDVDNDGVADAWELTHGMNPATASDSLAFNPLGYRMIEQYINELADENNTVAWTPTSTPGVYDHATIRGTGAANGSMTVTTAPTIAPAPQFLSLSIGGNGPAAGETLTVSGSGRLNVYDVITVGDFNNATVNVAGGTLSAYNIQLGHTDFSSGSGVNYTGTINLSGGTIRTAQILKGAGTPGSWTGGGTINWMGGTLQATGALKVNVPIALGGSGGTVDTNGFDGEISGAITGAGAFNKNGAGKLKLSGANSIGGPININAGSLAIANANSLGAAPQVVISNGAKLDATGAASSTVTAVSGQTITGKGAILGNLVAAAGSVIRPQAGFAIQGDTVAVQAEAMTRGSDWAVFNAATHGTGNGGTYGGAGLSGGGVVLVSGESLTVPTANGGLSATVNIPTAGTWKLFAKLVEPATSGVTGDPSTAAGGNNSFYLSNNASSLGATLGSPLTVQTITNATNSASSHWTVISAATTPLTGVVGPPNPAGIDYNLAAGTQTFSIYGREIGTILDAFVLSTTNLTAAQLDAALNPAVGNFTQQANSTLRIDVPVGAFTNTLAVGGTASLAGKLMIDLATGVTPLPSDQLTILTASSIAGTFTGVPNGARALTTNGGSFQVTYASNNVKLSNFLAPIASDFDHNGLVDSADLAVWSTASALGTTAGDANGDGVTDGADFLLWQQQLGGTVLASAAAGTVPEPASVMLLVIAATACRRRRSHARQCARKHRAAPPR